MRSIILIISLMIINQPSGLFAQGKKNVYVPAFQEILDSAQMSGSILIYDAVEQSYYSNDFHWANRVG